MELNTKTIEKGDVFKSTQEIRYLVPGRGDNVGHVEGKVISTGMRYITLEDQMGHEYTITCTAFFKYNKLKNYKRVELLD